MRRRRTGAVAVLAVAALAGSCDGSSEVGAVQVDVFDEPVECDAEEQVCFAAADPERVVEPETHRSWVFFSDQTSAHYPDGAYVYFELKRPDGARAYVQIDVPTDERGGEPVVSYEEHRGGELLFEADDVRGRVEVAEDLLGEECDCTDGRLELVLTDAGADETVGTDDDRVRRLSRARFGWSESFCVTAQMLGMRDDGVEVDVRVVDRCYHRSVPDRPSTSPEPSTSSGSTSTTASAGCESDGYTSTSSSSGSGCEGDSSSSSSGGCEGDTSSSSGGCEGDTGGGGGCSGDTGGGGGCAGTTVVAGGGSCGRGGGPSGPQVLLASGRVQLVAMLLLAILWLNARRRPAWRAA